MLRTIMSFMRDPEDRDNRQTDRRSAVWGFAGAAVPNLPIGKLRTSSQTGIAATSQS